MCEPATLMLAAGAISAAGTVMGGLQANAMGRYQAQVAEQNSRMSNEAARDSIARGKEENLALGRKVGQVKGDQAAAMAANGIDVGYGSAQRTTEDTAMLAREDQAALAKNIDQRTRGFDIEAANFTAQAKAERYRGKQAMIGSFFQGASTLAGAAGQASKFNFMQQPGPKPLGL